MIVLSSMLCFVQPLIPAACGALSRPSVDMILILPFAAAARNEVGAAEGLYFMIILRFPLEIFSLPLGYVHRVMRITTAARYREHFQWESSVEGPTGTLHKCLVTNGS